MSCRAGSWNARSKSCGEIRCVAVPVGAIGGSVDVCWGGGHETVGEINEK